MQCPSNSFVYNTTQCACNPGYLYNSNDNSCRLFVAAAPVNLSSGVSYGSGLNFRGNTIFSFDSIKKFTQSQAVFLEATAVMLLTWLIFCLCLRLFPLGNDGQSPWFKIRWWISRLDITFATRHWLDDQKVVKKRKTELGGTFSIASWILFIGLFAALLYQIISKRSVEVHNVRATNAPDLEAFSNDLEFYITTISSMSCANLRGLGTIATGTLGFIDYRVASLSTFANFSCLNSTLGPTIALKCSNCQLNRDTAYVSWQFVDLPNIPATALGFQFNLTAKNPANKKRVSYVSGMVNNASNLIDKPITYRGTLPNILKFNLFPRIYHNLHDLRLIQPLFHEFLPGSFFSEISQLQASLQSSSGGLINTTIYINFLSSYVVEIDNQNILGPVSFLADLGGLYCISIGIFFYFLVQCEYRIKRLRNEDSVMRKIRSRRKAQERWQKLRKYVMYTWGASSLDDTYNNAESEACCSGITMKPLHQSRSSKKRRLQSSTGAISFSRRSPGEKECPISGNVSEEVESTVSSNLKDVCQSRTVPIGDDTNLPPPPQLELKASDEIRMIDLQNNLQKLYDYNVMLREKLVAAQSMVHALSQKDTPQQVPS